MEIEKRDKCDLKLYMWQHRKVLKLGSRLEGSLYSNIRMFKIDFGKYTK